MPLVLQQFFIKLFFIFLNFKKWPAIILEFSIAQFAKRSRKGTTLIFTVQRLGTFQCRLLNIETYCEFHRVQFQGSSIQGRQEFCLINE